MELSNAQASVIVAGMFCGVFAFYGSRAMTILERVPQQAWFDKVDAALNKVIEMGVRVENLEKRPH